MNMLMYKLIIVHLFLNQKPLTMADNKNKSMRVRMVLESISPILMNPMTQDILDGLAGITKGPGQNKDKSAEERAEMKVIRNDEKQVGIPIEYFLGSLKGAGRLVKNGTKAISTATSTTIFDLLDIKGDFFPFKNQNEEMITDMRRGVLRNGAANVAVSIIRPKFKKWSVDMEVEFDTSAISEKTVRELIDAAGRKIGVGDFRPSKNGPFGRYKVANWQVVTE